LSDLVDADDRVLGSSYTTESVFLSLEAASAKEARLLGEAIVREALPHGASVHASQVYDDEGNVAATYFAKPS
jgi:hypothetical protein